MILPSNLEEIKRQAFNLCGISAMSIPSSVKTIGKEAFSGCALLKSVTLPENITEIADQMFIQLLVVVDGKSVVQAEINRIMQPFTVAPRSEIFH